LQETYTILLVHRKNPAGQRWAAALSKPSYRVLWVQDGEQGAGRLRKGGVHAVVYESAPHRIGLLRLLETAAQPELKPVQIVVTDRVSAETVAAWMRAGVDEVLDTEAPAQALLNRLQRLLEKQAVLLPLDEAQEASPLDRLVGRSGSIAQLKRQLVQLAPARSAVLFTGETGTGKTLAAEILHTISPRADQPFLRVDCPALPRSLIDSELFGHERGAFTDAKEARSGVFERARGGTVLLEEVSDLPGPTQSLILRLLEAGEMRRIGSSAILRPNVRILAATAESLEALAARGNIRKSLLYRLEGIRMHMPPLRERSEDVRDLVRVFVPRLCKAEGKATSRITRRALQRLAGFQWPGNVRQLLHTLEGMLATSKANLIDIADIPLELRGQAPSAKILQIPVGSPLADVEKTLIANTLTLTEGNKVRAARLLGIGLRTLYRKIKLYGI